MNESLHKIIHLLNEILEEEKKKARLTTRQRQRMIEIRNEVDKLVLAEN